MTVCCDTSTRSPDLLRSVCVCMCSQIGKFFSRFGEVMEVTLVLDMAKVLR